MLAGSPSFWRPTNLIQLCTVTMPLWPMGGPPAPAPLSSSCRCRCLRVTAAAAGLQERRVVPWFRVRGPAQDSQLSHVLVSSRLARSEPPRPQRNAIAAPGLKSPVRVKCSESRGPALAGPAGTGPGPARGPARLGAQGAARPHETAQVAEAHPKALTLSSPVT
jgi:hypothetical protein